MNWRHRVEKAITGKFSSRYDGSLVVGINKDVKKVINKCRIKYSGYRDMKHTSGNHFNKIKYYDVGGTIYRVRVGYIPDQCGHYQLPRKGKKALKIVERKYIYSSYEEVPDDLKNKVDFRMCDNDMKKVVVWKFIRGGY
jgi:hypothetical protein